MAFRYHLFTSCVHYTDVYVDNALIILVCVWIFYKGPVLLVIPGCDGRWENGASSDFICIAFFEYGLFFQPFPEQGIFIFHIPQKNVNKLNSGKRRLSADIIPSFAKF